MNRTPPLNEHARAEHALKYLAGGVLCTNVVWKNVPVPLIFYVKRVRAVNGSDSRTVFKRRPANVS
jgi:hypothetical protein